MVRPHVARAVAGTGPVVLDFDGVMFDFAGAMPERALEDAIAHALDSVPYRPRPVPVSLAWFGVQRTLEYLVAHEPDHAILAEAAVSRLELDGALTARRATGLTKLLIACAETGRKVAVVSDLGQEPVLATLKAHRLSGLVAAVAARQGTDTATFGIGDNLDRAIAMLRADAAECLVVSGTRWVLSAGRDIGAVCLGCECGRNSRKYLAGADTPVVRRLAVLTEAIWPVRG